MNLTDRHAYLLLNRLGSLRRPVCQLLAEGARPAEIVRRVLRENLLGKAAKFEERLQGFDPVKEETSAAAAGIRILTLADGSYPPALKNSSDPPLVLYLLGELLPSDSAAVAVVGARHANLYGIQQARRFARELAEAGMTVVSGMADGVDQAAHAGALESSIGRTVAVLGCGLDVAYPKNSSALKDEVMQRGALLSEFPLGTPPLAENFPQRNRIIASLALGVLVVQASTRSGSLITARLALEEGKEVFALPGRVDDPGSRGAHALIKEGAALVDTPGDILEALAAGIKACLRARAEKITLSEAPSSEPAAETTAPLPAPMNRILELLKDGPLNYEEMALRAEMGLPELMPALMRLELGRSVRKGRDGRFAVC